MKFGFLFIACHSLLSFSQINIPVLESISGKAESVSLQKEIVADYSPKIYDIVISEIMFDPSPVILLPDAEYIELYNTSQQFIRSEKWSIEVNAKKVVLPDFTINPGSYIILTDILDSGKFDAGLPMVYVKKLPALTNTGAVIILRDSSGMQMHYLKYDKYSYRDTDKDEGGYSLEMIDPENPCNYEENYVASKDATGGTPGRKNSVKSLLPDMTAPFLDHVGYFEENKCQLFFSERMDSIAVVNPGSYRMDNPAYYFTGKGELSKDFTSCTFTLLPQLPKDEQLEIIVAGNLIDCVTNPIQENISARYAWPEPADSFDLIFNEIMFHPAKDGVEYIEIFNRSNKTIDLVHDSILLHEFYTLEAKNSKLITKDSYLIFPGDIVVLTSDKKTLEATLSSSNQSIIIEMDLPQLNNNEGIISLKDNFGTILDLVVYNKEDHFKVLKNDAGVSLERTCYDCITNIPGTWHSASGTSGFATPGYENSQMNTLVEPTTNFFIEPRVISPDNDGHDDYLTIGYQLKDLESLASITIFDARGRKIKNLLNNSTLDAAGSVTWDGTNNNNQRVSMGVYVIYMEVISLNGPKKEYLKSCVVAPQRR